MTWALFRLAFRQSLAPTLLLVGAILATLVGIERVVEARLHEENLDILFNLLIAGFVVWSGFPTGSRLFAQEFREKHSLLLYALPLSRTRSWLGLVAGGLAAGGVSVAAALVIRVSLLGLGGTALPSTWVVGLLTAAYLVFFGAGCCYGLFLGGNALHAIGLVATVGLLGVLLAWMRHIHFLVSARVDVALDVVLVNLLAALLLTTAFYLTLSCRVFVRGEFRVPRVFWGSIALVVGGHLAFLLLLQMLVDLRVRSEPFVSAQPFPEIDLAPGGDLVSLIERRQGYPRFARINVVDVSRGETVGAIDIEGALSATWAANGTLLAVLAAERSPVERWIREVGRAPWADHGDVVYWVSREAEIVGAVDLDEPAMDVLRAGQGLLVRSEGETGSSLIELGAGPGAPTTTVATGDGVGRWRVSGLEGGGVVAVWLPNTGVTGRALRLDPPRGELRWVGRLDGGVREAGVVGGAVFAGDAVTQELDRRLPPLPDTASERARFLVWESFDQPTWSYGLAEGPSGEGMDIAALAPGAEEWVPLVRTLPTAGGLDGYGVASRLHDEGCVYIGPGLSRRWLCPEGIVATSDDGRGSFTVRDLASGNENEIPGTLRFFWVVSSEVAVALVDAVPPKGDAVPLEGRAMKIVSVPMAASESPPLWSAAVQGSVYYDLDEQALFLWRAGSPIQRLWPSP